MTPASLAYLHLCFAIIFEIIATSLLQRSEQFTRLMPSAFTILFYAAAFYFLSLSLRVMPVGVAYAIWSGVGIVLISLIGWVFFKQKLDLAAMIGIAFIVEGGVAPLRIKPSIISLSDSTTSMKLCTESNSSTTFHPISLTIVDNIDFLDS